MPVSTAARPRPSSRRRSGVVVAALAALAVLAASACTAVTPAAPSEAVANPAKCTELRAAQRANRPLFALSTTWNVPAACLPLDPQSGKWATRWFEYANRDGRTDRAAKGDIDLAFDDYSSPIYSLAEATGTTRVFITNYGYGHNLGPNRSIPWNPSWRPAPGNDHDMIIVDPATGREWDLWGVQLENWSTCLTVENLLAGFVGGQDLCVAMASIGTDPDGSISDYRTSSGFSLGFGRGFGEVLGLALLPTLNEIERGSIHHALNMETYATMFGPACTTSQMSTSAAGSTCGYAVAPATRLEFPDGPSNCGVATQPDTTAGRSMTVPEGMRFVIDLTDDEIRAWLDARGLTGGKRRLAQIFATALRDYGWIISTTSCHDSSVTLEGIANPTAAARWRALGVTDPVGDGDGLLDGLIPSASRVHVVAPPSASPILTSD